MIVIGDIMRIAIRYNGRWHILRIKYFQSTIEVKGSDNDNHFEGVVGIMVISDYISNKPLNVDIIGIKKIQIKIGNNLRVVKGKMP